MTIPEQEVHQDNPFHSERVLVGKMRRDGDGIYVIDPAGDRSMSFPDVFTVQQATLRSFPEGYLLLLDPDLLQDDPPEAS